MRIHFSNPLLYGHPIAQVALPLIYMKGEPWPFAPLGDFGGTDPVVKGRAIARALARRDEGFRTLHIGWAERYLTDPNLAAAWGGSPSAPTGPRLEELCYGIVNNCLSAGNLVAMLEPIVAEMRRLRTRLIDLIYVDAEFWPNSDATSEAAFPGAWALLRQLYPGMSAIEIEARVKAAVFTALRAAIAAVGLDPSVLTCFGFANRTTGWGHNPVAALPLTVSVPRPNIIATTAEDLDITRLRNTLRATTGASRCTLLLSTIIDAALNAQAFRVAEQEGVQDVILYGDVTIPSAQGGDAALNGQPEDHKLAMQILAATPRLDAHIDLVREYATAA